MQQTVVILVEQRVNGESARQTRHRFFDLREKLLRNLTRSQVKTPLS